MIDILFRCYKKSSYETIRLMMISLTGFSNEANFFRTFRQVTGKPPSEWKESKI